MSAALPVITPTTATATATPSSIDSSSASSSSVSSSASSDISRIDLSQLPLSGLPLYGLGKAAGPRAIVLEFENGTKCDIESMDRSTSVHISCGARDAIIDVVEDRTCHYNVKVTSPVICLLTDFAPRRQKFIRVELARNGSSSSSSRNIHTTDTSESTSKMTDINDIANLKGMKSKQQQPPPETVRKVIPVMTTEPTKYKRIQRKSSKKKHTEL